jgi:hypothetical protein
MVHTLFAALLLLGALITGALAARDQLRAPAVTSPLLAAALLCATALAIMARHPPEFFFKGSVVLALLIALIACAIMLIEGTPQLVRVGANVPVYFILWLGFLVTAGRAFWTLPALGAFAAGFLATGVLFFAVRARAKWLSLSVLIYTINGALVVGGAAALLVVRPALWSLLALLGALLYVGVDALAAWVAWRTPVRRAGLYSALLAAYGALLLAISTWGARLLSLWPFA